jgi:hypothetical protein
MEWLFSTAVYTTSEKLLLATASFSLLVSILIQVVLLYLMQNISTKVIN